MNILFSSLALKQLKKAPKHIAKRANIWRQSVEYDGLLLTRKRPGWHDEPLKGDRKGQRSVRLNQQWRLIYCEVSGEVLEVLEVTPHDY